MALKTLGVMTEEEAEAQKVYEEKVNHPDHYNQEGSMECIDEMRLLVGKDDVAGFCRCNVIKYRYRYNVTHNQTDLDKAEWYIRYLDKLLKENPMDMMGGML